MTVLIQIRDVDEATRQRLKERAADEGISLNTLLKQILEREAQIPSRRALMSRLRARGDVFTGSSVEYIHDAREEHDAHLRDIVGGR